MPAISGVIDMIERYWLVQPNGARQLIDARDFDIVKLTGQLQQLGGELVVETEDEDRPEGDCVRSDHEDQRLRVAGYAISLSQSSDEFEPPASALSPLFRARLEQIHNCRTHFSIEMNTRPTGRVLGGYYKKRRLVRIYTHDRQTGRRPLAELFDTFLHEVAHHLEYTEPDTFSNRGCGRVRGCMHSPLFWQILGILKQRWGHLQRA